MKKILITGGNSGIGLEVARQLLRAGHEVTIVGRDAAKGKLAVDDLAKVGGKIDFVAADLSTHAGVRAFTDAFAASHDALDALVLGAGVLRMSDLRTSDDLNEVFAVNYLSRFHVAERLKPLLLKSADPRVVILVAGVPLDSKVDFKIFPEYKPFPGMGALSSVQIANFHYVQHLAAEGKISAAVANVGLVKTGIMRAMPAPMRIMFNLLGPLFTISVQKAAANLVLGVDGPKWEGPRYWAKPGDAGKVVSLALDKAVTDRVVSESRRITGLS